jgi:hypothetical protein
MIKQSSWFNKTSSWNLFKKADQESPAKQTKEDEHTEPESEKKEEESESQKAGPDVIAKAFTSFLIKNKDKDISDDDVHKWAEENKFETPAVEAIAYSFAKKLVNLFNEGKAKEKGLTADQADAEQIKKGLKVEAEHTSDPQLQQKISLDHLAEFPKYYDALDEMESKLKKGQ